MASQIQESKKETDQDSQEAFDGSSYRIHVSIVGTQFKKRAKYFLAMGLRNSDKHRTDVAEESETPVFRENLFHFDIPKQDTNVGLDKESLSIAAFVEVDDQIETESSQEHLSAKAKRLGDCEVDLGSLYEQLIQGKSIIQTIAIIQKREKVSFLPPFLSISFQIFNIEFIFLYVFLLFSSDLIQLAQQQQKINRNHQKRFVIYSFVCG